MNNSETAFLPCGIEISFKVLVINLSGKAPCEFANTPDGHQCLIRMLQLAGSEIHVCMEATGLYGLDLALALHAAGIAFMIANPRSVRNFARAMMQRSKTDKLDAIVLREYAARMPFEPWRPPSPQALHLMAIAHRIQALTRMITAEKNRLHAASLSRALPAVVRHDLARSIQSLERALKRLTLAALELVMSDPQLARRNELLLSVPGIGVTSALNVLAEILRLGPDCGVRQWVAFAGLDPRHYTSGTSVAKKTIISKSGNAHLRRALYMPALVTVQHEPHFRGFYQHLVARGKTKLQAIVAVMRKLLHAIYGMFKHNQLFDGSKVYALETSCA
jgi:transposase